jgi:glucokinase
VSLTDPSTTYVLGVDVGGTKTLVALVRLTTAPGGTPVLEPGSPVEIVERQEVPSSAASLDAVDVIESRVVEMIERAGADRPVRGVGIGMAGYLDLGGIVRVSPNAPGLVGIDLRSRLAGSVGLPVTTENDANCVAIAANHLLAPASGDLVAVTLGTGIGGGIILDGELVRGAHGFAAEPGHTVIDPSGPRCPCGQRGCWERFASGSGLRYLARRAAEAGNADAVRRRAGSLDAIRGELITTMVAEGDRGAVAIFDEFIRYLTIGVANLINVIDPEVIVLGGGLIEAGDRLVEGVRTELRANYPTTTVRRDVQVEWSSGPPTARVSLEPWSFAGSRRFPRTSSPSSMA